jgi:hypothetical protein
MIQPRRDGGEHCEERTGAWALMIQPRRDGGGQCEETGHER